MEKMTQKQIFVIELFVDYYKKNGKGACGAEIVEIYKKDLEKNGITTPNSLIATASSCASETKDFLDKSTKKEYKGKYLTCFIPKEKALALQKENK